MLFLCPRGSIRAPAGAWSLAVTTLHRSVALYRSSFESFRMLFVPIKNDGLRPSFFIAKDYLNGAEMGVKKRKSNMPASVLCGYPTEEQEREES